MRRPLNGNGTPLSIDSADPIVLFDASALDPSYAYAITLSTYFDPLLTTIAVLTVDEGAGTPPINVGVYTPLAMKTLQALGRGSAKLVDRLVLRGNQRLVFTPTLYAGAQWLFGYFERAGVAALKGEYRPLQPSDLMQAPYNAPIQQLSVPAGGGAAEVVLHTLEGAQEHTDILSFNVLAYTDGAAPSAGRVLLHFPGLATPLELVPDAFVTEGAFPFVIFEDIPIRPSGPSPADTQIKLSIVPDPAVAVLATAFGRFTRQ